MKIVNNAHYEGLYRSYPLDATQIGNVSINKQNIRLPYNGELPCEYDRAEISFIVRPHYVSVTLHIYCGHEHDAFTVEAEREEINEIMWRFFFCKKRPSGCTYYTRFRNGLSSYWTGHLQADYLMWREYTGNPAKLTDIARQLTAEQRKSLIYDLQQMGA